MLKLFALIADEGLDGVVAASGATIVVFTFPRMFGRDGRGFA